MPKNVKICILTMEMMERPPSRIIVTMATLAAAGLLATGCSVETPQTGPQPTASQQEKPYDAPEGADALPLLPVKDLPPPSASTYINARNFAYSSNAVFADLGNPYPESVPANQRETRLPVSDSAPVLDVMIGSDGELRYKNHYPQEVHGIESILTSVAATSPLLKPAMRSGQLGELHVRVFEPNQYPGSPDLEPGDYAVQLRADYNDDGKPSVYL